MFRSKLLSRPEKWILWGIPALFILGGGWHFLYDFLPFVPVAIIAPANDSVWEHLKMGLFPVIAWWFIYFFVKQRRENFDVDAWFTGALVALVTTITTMPLVFYFYRGAFGVEASTTFSLYFDMFILFLSNALGQLLGWHFYRRSIGIKAVFAFVIILIIFGIFVLFTFFPPNFPLFFDHFNGHFGIYGR